MPIFWILVIIGLFLVWLILSFCFKPIGRAAKRLWGDARKAMSEDHKKEIHDKENKELAASCSPSSLWSV